MHKKQFDKVVLADKEYMIWKMHNKQILIS